MSFNCNRIYETARRTLELYVINRKRLESPIDNSLFETKAVGAGCLYQEGEKTYIFSVEHLNPEIDCCCQFENSIVKLQLKNIFKQKEINYDKKTLLSFLGSIGIGYAIFFCSM